ncbi:M23 family metallopeptidase [Candidatus Soleaferrea massiliensis]|uniref:M23 family metallopeptidase n=1 Tax=Candidatus Soleaferrea massiliensis TaxID=1470354 RepID=UPI000693324B|nr:M23 family metallopeptidase [Candidatus Soleaferrea massiliensis]
MDYERYNDELTAHRNRRNEHRAKPAGAKKKDIITPVLIVQSLICIVLLLACFAVKLVGGGFYEKSRLKYANMLTDKTIENQLTENVLKFADQVPAVRQVFDAVGGYVDDLATMLHIDTGKPAEGQSADLPSNTPADDAREPERDAWKRPADNAAGAALTLYPRPPADCAFARCKPGSAAAFSNSAAAVSSTQKQNSVSVVSEGVASGSAASVQGTSAESGMGGMIEVADPGNGDILTPPDSATLAPVYLSAKPSLPLHGTITSPYGYRMHPTTGKLDFHNAVDIAAPQGTPISCVLPGKVKKVVQDDDIYGNYVVVEHSENLSTKYAHCSVVLVKEGTVLREGETIAQVGSTGIATGPHCHYEILVNEINVDPAWVYDLPDEEDESQAV